MKYDVIIVGAGISGLTAAAYSTRAGYKTLLIERESKVGGLVSSFNYKGFGLDGGIRAIESSGIVLPMLRQLEIDITFLQSTVSLGVEKDVITVTEQTGLDDYQELLNKKFPENQEDIANIMKEIKLIMKYMDILYGIDNPVFLDVVKDRKYFITKIIPWMFKYLFTHKKVEKRATPVEEYLRKYTDNQVLIDVIAQHFFKETPAYFALSYFSLYFDYKYPKGGTGTLPLALEKYIKEHDGEILLNTEIKTVDSVNHVLFDQNDNHYHYSKLVWSSNLHSLYQFINYDNLPDNAEKQAIIDRRDELQDKVGGDSIFSVYATTNLPPEYFNEKCSAHFFYTPYKTGLYNTLGKLDTILKTTDKQTIKDWLKEFLHNTTFEVSIPALRDPDLAPPGKIGVIISTLFEYEIAKHIQDLGWYEEFKQLGQDMLLNVMHQTIFPRLNDNIIDKFSATPLTVESRTKNSHGAITGWAFTNKKMPAVSTLIEVAKSVRTPITDVYQSGQWTYSPAGLPVSILTGKLAFDRVHKELKKQKKKSTSR